jgi:hypothetical protein
MHNINFNAKCTRFRDGFDRFHDLIDNRIWLEERVYNMFEGMGVSTMRSIL